MRLQRLRRQPVSKYLEDHDFAQGCDREVGLDLGPDTIIRRARSETIRIWVLLVCEVITAIVAVVALVISHT
jgi:hypothetical protein